MSLDSARGQLPPGPWHYEDGRVVDVNGVVVCTVADALKGRILERVPEMLDVVAHTAVLAEIISDDEETPVIRSRRKHK